MDFILLIESSKPIAITSIIVIAFLVSLFITLVNYFVLDKDKMRESKARQKSIQEEIKQHKDNPSKVMELQKEMMAHSMETMRHSFKPMLITFIPIVIIFAIIRGWYTNSLIAGSWFWIYFGSSIVASILFRKWFNLP